MNKDDYNHFVCIAAGENPDAIMAEYDKNKKVEKRLVYRFKDAKKIKESFIKEYESAMKDEINPSQREYIRLSIEDLKEMDDDDFYFNLAEDNGYLIDEETCDAYSDKNEEGKWSVYSIGKLFSIPFLTKDGKEVFQAKKGDIDWSKIHLNGGEIYGRAWDMVVCGVKPETEYEMTIYENMRDKTTYFQKFGTRENYIISNTAFWGYAFVSDKTGWMDASEEKDQFAWMSNFYNLFIKNLDDNTLLTIFECRK